MTLESSVSVQTMLADGVLRDFPFSFRAWEGQVRVLVADPVGNETDVTSLSKILVEGEAGGVVSYPAGAAAAALPAGWKLTVMRDMNFRQETNIVTPARFDAQVIEARFDKLTAQDQQLLEAVSRAVKISVSSEAPPVTAEDLYANVNEIADRAEVAVQGAEDAVRRAETAVGRAEAAREGAQEAEAATREAAREFLTSGLEAVTAESAKQKELIARAGSGALFEIAGERDRSLEEVVEAGNAQADRLRAAGTAERLALAELADGRQALLSELGEGYAAAARASAAAAGSEAERAAAAAALAEDLSHIGPASASSYGFVRVGEGISVTADGTISVDSPALVTTPSLDFPAVVGIGYPYVLSMSAQSLYGGAGIKNFRVTLDEQNPVTVIAQNDAASLEITPNGAPESVGSIKVIAYDTADNFSRVQSLTFRQNAVVLRAPRISAPADGAENVSLTPTVAVQDFSISGISAEPINTQIQFAADADFISLLADSGPDYPYATSYAVSAQLPVGSVVYVRARHRAEKYGWSAWGSVSRFTTMTAGVNRPSVLAPANNEINVVLRPTVQVSAFGNSGPLDTAKGTQIQISNNSGFTAIVAEHNGAYATTFTPSANLDLTSTYYVRARHQGNLWGWSPWSAVSVFSTQGAALTQPAILSPTLGQTGVGFNPPITISAPVADNQTWQSAQCRVKQGETIVYDSGELPAATAFTSSGVNGINTRYTVEVRVKGSVSGWGDWVSSSFTTMNVTLGAPGITSPANGTTGVALNPQIKISAPAVLNQTVTQVECRVKQGSSIVWNSGQVAWATSFTPSGISALNTEYTIEARAAGSITGWGAWATTTFTTLAASLGAPAITSPANNATGVQPDTLIQWSAPAVVGQSIDNYWLEIATDAGFSNKVLSGWVGAVTAYAVALPAFSCLYYARVAAHGSITGQGAYSPTVSFTSVAQPAAQDYALPGTYTYSVPASGRYLLMAAGAGSGSWGFNDSVYGCTGGSGAAAYAVANLAGGSQVAVVVGQGGAGRLIDGYPDKIAAGSGGSSSVGPYVSATGGVGGRGDYDMYDGAYPAIFPAGGVWQGDAGVNGNAGLPEEWHEKSVNGGSSSVSVSYGGHTVTSGAGGNLNASFYDDRYVSAGGNGQVKIICIGVR